MRVQRYDVVRLVRPPALAGVMLLVTDLGEADDLQPRSCEALLLGEPASAAADQEVALGRDDVVGPVPEHGWFVELWNDVPILADDVEVVAALSPAGRERVEAHLAEHEVGVDGATGRAPCSDFRAAEVERGNAVAEHTEARLAEALDPEPDPVEADAAPPPFPPPSPVSGDESESAPLSEDERAAADEAEAVWQAALAAARETTPAPGAPTDMELTALYLGDLEPARAFGLARQIREDLAIRVRYCDLVRDLEACATLPLEEDLPAEALALLEDEGAAPGDSGGEARPTVAEWDALGYLEQEAFFSQIAAVFSRPVLQGASGEDSRLDLLRERLAGQRLSAPGLGVELSPAVRDTFSLTFVVLGGQVSAGARLEADGGRLASAPFEGGVAVLRFEEPLPAVLSRRSGLALSLVLESGERVALAFVREGAR